MFQREPYSLFDLYHLNEYSPRLIGLIVHANETNHDVELVTIGHVNETENGG